MSSAIVHTFAGRAGNFFIAVGLMVYGIGSAVASSKRKHQVGQAYCQHLHQSLQLQLDLKRAERKARHDREALEKMTGKKKH